MTDLVLETKEQRDNPPFVTAGGGTVMITPPIDEEYWAYRVRLSDIQTLVGFPKFSTIGIGFAVEEDWNTNLPYTTDAADIFRHISHNKGDDSISDERCIEAIQMIIDAATAERGAL